ncbi:putative TetR-family transcriptional regulator [Lentzea sp. NBRC 105346]|uniref:TetR/AcrR family transcriptional regulator n=1 Tax=Lentzea sp. NBRC 105346 TaxID=3032205 RepID=UPI0024A3E291|nr:TetR family transcriptional regulator [Lentzea sp. NBRC 105346]GLZ35297.1 putative TetR-family transcriptional regulator [Lentzea sp. NBRC 105346]
MTQSRQQLVAGAADMLRRRGLNATSIREVAKHAQAPLGSTYHYFPGGKQQLATEAVRWASDTVAEILRAKLKAGPVDGLRGFLALWREIITGNDFEAGCTVVAVSIEADSTALAAAADAFSTWEEILADSLRSHGAENAEQLATLIVASVEGAVVLCRAQRSAVPLERVGAQLEDLVRAATR